VYSRFVAPLSPIPATNITCATSNASCLAAGSGNHNRYFDNAFETTGPSRIARDSGYSAWIEVTHLRNVNVQIGFTRSIHYDLSTITLMVNFDGTSLIRTLTAWHRD